jgi:hypothetical protein
MFLSRTSCPDGTTKEVYDLLLVSGHRAIGRQSGKPEGLGNDLHVGSCKICIHQVSSFTLVTCLLVSLSRPALFSETGHLWPCLEGIEEVLPEIQWHFAVASAASFGCTKKKFSYHLEAIQDTHPSCKLNTIDILSDLTQ